MRQAGVRRNGRWQLPSLLVGIIVIAALRLLWAHSYLTEGLPFYSIDENDIVEPAAGFLMGDWNHQYYAYGPTFMYLLSFLYAVAAPLKGQSVYVFATDVFFDGYWHYYLARLLSLLIILGTAAVAVIETQRLFSFLAAVLCLVLLAFPIAENFTRYTARIDVLQALFQLLALFSVIKIFDTGARRHYVWGGVWAGLAIAAKPIAGALIVPVALGVTLLRVWQERAPSLGKERFARKGWGLIGHFLFDRRLHWALVAGALAFFVGFPWVVLDPQNFWWQQMVRIQADSREAFPRGSDVVHYVSQAGWFLCVLGAVALLYQAFRGTARARITAAFAILYLLAFAHVPAREYFFVAILAPVGICIALLLRDLLHHVKRWEIRGALIVTLALVILATLPRPAGNSRQSARMAVQGWIIGNIPAGTGLCYAGWHTDGPRLVSVRLEDEARNDYFMYGRDKNENYVRGFGEAHHRYRLSGRPLYDIANWGRRDARSPEGRAQLLAFCRGRGSRYLVLGGIPPFDSLPAPVTNGGGIFVFKL